MAELEKYLDEYDIGGTSGGDTSSGENVSISKEEYNKLLISISELSQKVDNLEITSNEKIQRLQESITTMTTWKIVNVNLKLPIVEWTPVSQTVPELIGAKKLAFWDSTNDCMTYLENVATDRSSRAYWTNGIPDEYNFSALIGFDINTGKINLWTARIGINIKNDLSKFLPVISKVYYIK